jgi:multicomponent Na+:H+ antiporter subunit F
MMIAAALALLAAMALMLARLLAGPTLYDRVLAVNSFGTKTVLFLAVFASLIERPDAVDIAILYALVNFVATIAVLKFFRFRSFELALARMGVRAPDRAGAGSSRQRQGEDEGSST